jgi:hypothetical protein
MIGARIAPAAITDALACGMRLMMPRRRNLEPRRALPPPDLCKLAMLTGSTHRLPPIGIGGGLLTLRTEATDSCVTVPGSAQDSQKLAAFAATNAAGRSGRHDDQSPSDIARHS